MRGSRHLISIFVASFYLICISNEIEGRSPGNNRTANFNIGWSSADLTPDSPVLLNGQFAARISEGVMDPITATVLAIESGSGPNTEKVILISCDLVNISDGTRDESADNLRDNVRNLLKKSLPELSPAQVILNATHTHTAPYCSSDTGSKSIYGIELEALSPVKCQKYISERIAKAAERAWKNRKPGGISFGLGQAVVGHNRLVADLAGKSAMYGKTNTPEFSNLEGYEDHSVNLLYTWNKQRKLTGIVINLACPSQVSENGFLVTADYWHDTRLEVRKRLGNNIFILPQCSAAGDQSPHILVGEKAEERMQRIMGSDSVNTGRGSIGRRKQIATQIADAVTSVFPYMKDNIDWAPIFYHNMAIVNLSRRLISMDVVKSSVKEGERLEKQFDQQLLKIKEDPEIKKDPRWYTQITNTYSSMKRGYTVKDRYELEQRQPKMPVEVHIVRIGDVVIATNPFELYLDYGMRIKGRSPAVQTFLVQLTGSGTYLPPSRSVAGGSYGAVPASTLIGPEGGQELVEKTLELINDVWQRK